MGNRQNQSDTSHRLLLLVIFTILGVILGCGIGYGVSSLASRSVFSFWKPIASDTIVPEKILYANSNSIWVETDRGEVYFHKLNCLSLSADCTAWNMEENPSRLNSYEANPFNNEECAVHVFIRPSAPPQNSVQCVYASRVHTLNDGFTYYALSEDNKIWYWRTPNRIQKLLTIIFSTLIGLFVGFFFGRDVTLRRKGQYKEVLGNLAYLFASMFLFAIAGFILGVIAGNVILKFESKGVFTSWRLLESPVKFTKIVDANTNTIWAQSEDEKIYYRRLSCAWETCDTWEETDITSDEVNSTDGVVVFGNTCSFKEGNPAQENIKPQKQPDNVVECAMAYDAMYESAWTAYYALLDDGTIWSWKHTSDMFKSIFISLYSVLAGVISGAIIGIVVFIVRKSRLKKNSLKA